LDADLIVELSQIEMEASIPKFVPDFDKKSSVTESIHTLFFLNTKEQETMNTSSFVKWFISSDDAGDIPSPSSPSTSKMHVIEINTEPMTPSSEQEQGIEASPSFPPLESKGSMARRISSLVSFYARAQDPPGLLPSNSCSSSDGKKATRLSETDSSSDSSMEEMEKGKNGLPEKEEKPENHLKLFAHDRLWTGLGLFSTWMGFMFAYLARSSTEFVTLEVPVYVDPIFDKVSSVGMINLQLCFNETFAPTAQGCITDQLGSDEVEDVIFQVARSFAFLAVLLGGFMSVMLTSAVVWYSINLRPIGLGYLFAYFLQSFTFLFFDTKLCSAHGCNISSGGYQCIAASIFWIIACIAASRMDAIKYHLAEKKKRRRNRKQKKQKKLNPKSPVTTRTSSSSTDSDTWDVSSSDDSTSDPDGIAPNQLSNFGIVSSFPVSADAVETSFHNLSEHADQEHPICNVKEDQGWLKRQSGKDFPSKQHVRIVMHSGPAGLPQDPTEKTKKSSRKSKKASSSSKSNKKSTSNKNDSETPPRKPSKESRGKRSKSKINSPKRKSQRADISPEPASAKSSERYRVRILTDS
jgi:hypothetical protein